MTRVVALVKGVNGFRGVNAVVFKTVYFPPQASDIDLVFPFLYLYLTLLTTFTTLGIYGLKALNVC